MICGHFLFCFPFNVTYLRELRCIPGVPTTHMRRVREHLKRYTWYQKEGSSKACVCIQVQYPKEGPER